MHAERTGTADALLVFVVCIAASAIGWYPLGGFTRVIELFVPVGGCGGVKEGTPAMFVCAAVIGALTVARSLLAVAVLAWFRVPLARWIGRFTRRIPDEAQLLIVPVLATALFVIPWAGAHVETAGSRGLLPQTQFPAVVGLFAYIAIRYGAWLQTRLTAFLQRRDRYPPRSRAITAIALALIISVALNRSEHNEAVREQIVVLFLLIALCLALMPRAGDLLPPLRLHTTPQPEDR